jgi:Cys-tRNA(Pro)/Cys-tRNA(Cys) deacylase
MSSKKLNSMRLLEQQSIPYELLTFSEDIHDAAQVAEVLGVPPEMVYKTLVLEVEGAKPLLAMVPAPRHLDLKKLAKAAGLKKVSMARHADAEKWTGLLTGGISPLMLVDKKWKLFLDQSASGLQQIMLSAGQRGMNLRVPSLGFIQLMRPILAEICTDSEAS